MARPPLGAKLVEGMEGSEEAKRRLQVILETLSGERTVGEACEALGINEARLYALRAEALEAALSRLEPKPAGRPRKETHELDEVSALRAELLEVRLDLQAARVREEIAIAMPHLLKPRGEGGKKTKKR